ncbi:MAG: HIT domain-containing protein [SAR324 cluster bacterium]|nr:HIT domain-containing protein [SAR324 cluster bacterium]
MTSIFTKIIQNKIPCEKIYETESEIAFLDISPWSYGHTLIVPKHEVAKLEDLSPGDASALMATLQTVATAISKTYDGADYKILLNNGENAGQEVPHVHFHIIPCPTGFRFNSRTRYSYAEGGMAQTGEKIRAFLK